MNPRFPSEPAESRPLLVEIASFWRHYNWCYVGERLTQPSFRLDGAATRLGAWHRETRVISLSEAHVLRDPWMGVMETLRHEMAHQYVDEILGGDDSAPHGPKFKEACQLLRVSPHASGKGGEVTPVVGGILEGDNPIREKISKLLSLATSSNEHEAQLAMEKARYLLLKYNLSLQDVGEAGSRYGVRQLGRPRSRVQRYENAIASLLRDFFFVEVIWDRGYDPLSQKRGTFLKIHGTKLNLDMAEYAAVFLENLLPQLWRAHQKAVRLRSNAGRLHYYWGVVVGFSEKLRGQTDRLAREQALVWKQDPRLTEFYRYVHPRTIARQSAAVRVHGTFQDGIQDGREVRLNRPVGNSSSGAVRGLLS